MVKVGPPPPSPCSHRCGFREGCCRQCYRTLEEVERWRFLSPEEKARVMERAQRRRTEAETSPA